VSRPDDRAEQLHRSWTANAGAWTDAVRERRIESRQVATDAAVLHALLDGSPRRVLDVGCGEGWLCRALSAHGISAAGVDGSAPLVERARELGGGSFHVLSYAELVDEPRRLGGAYDAIVCNYSLLEEEVVPLLSALYQLCAPQGVLVIQTVHPWGASGAEPYRDGWRSESFAKFGGAFANPMPWYFRTLASWTEVLQAARWRIRRAAEPRHPEHGSPLSLLFVCERQG
jgi:2-polyprenyl-3-methyl-5-hydroxy-6-metoxy-1,4-benzoquinol methylase